MTSKLLLIGCVAIGAGAQPSSHPSMILPDTTKKLSPHVYAIPDTESTPGVPNVGFVVGSKGVLVIDTGMGERNGRIVLDEARKAAPKRALYLVTTHVHPEHDLGAGAFPADTKMIRSADQKKDIAEFGYQTAQIFISRSAVNAELLKGAEFRKADIEFEHEYNLDLGGGVKARIMAMGPNHTRGDTAVFVASDACCSRATSR